MFSKLQEGGEICATFKNTFISVLWIVKTKMNFDFANTTLSLFFLTLCILIIWYYFCVTLPFLKMPSARFELVVVKFLLTNENMTSYVFKKVNALLRQNLSEGIMVMWMLKPFVLVFNEDFVKNILNNNLEKASEYRVFHEVIGLSLFTGDKILWKKRRKMYNPVFKIGMLKLNMDIFNKHAKTLVEELRQMDLAEPIQVTKHLDNFSVSVLSGTILGLNKDELFSASEIEKLSKSVDKVTEFFVHRIYKPWLNFPNLFPEGRNFLQKVKTLDDIIERILIEMKQSVTLRNASETTNGCDSVHKISSKSLAEVLIEHHMRDPHFTVEDMSNELKFFLIAGFNSVVYALNWILFLLGQHLDVQDSVYEEVKSLKENFDFEDLLPLTYLESVIKEGLRLYPTVPIYARSLENDVQLGKYKLPKGITVAVPVYMYHRNPNVFPNPDAFDPSRFHNANLEKSQFKYLPFSSGVRNCIGHKFAMLEMKVALVHILKNFQITSYEDCHSKELRWEIVLLPDKPIHMKLTPRN